MEINVSVKVPSGALKVIEAITGLNGQVAVEEFVTRAILELKDPQEEINRLVGLDNK